MPRKRPQAKPRTEAKARKTLEVRREVSAGGLIWRRNANNGSIEVVLVRPAGKGTWVLPKGHVEPGETLLEAALREANEESGLEVVADEPLGQVAYLYSWRKHPQDRPFRIFKRVHFYLMHCVGGDPSAHDGEIEEVVWLPLEAALARASHKSERNLIAKAQKLLLAENTQAASS
jgi:8-oxo-dGTP pyrophosphatase MutT (NUDIX family)